MLADGFADRDFKHARHLVRARNQFAIVAAFAEKLLGMRFLKVAAANFGGWNVRGDGKHRHTRALTIIQAIDQVHIPWA